MIWSTKQDAALVAVKQWLDNWSEGVFRLFGFAGSGKTTLAKEFASGLGGAVQYCAYTGKAASVLQSKGCTGATTIHRLIYKPSEKNKDRLLALKKELEDVEADLVQRGTPLDHYINDPQWKKVNEDLEAEKAMHRRPSFTLNEDSPIKYAKLVVVDEVSMVDEYIGRDLESFGVPILVLGDPFQLPPVRGCGYWTNHKPDILLDEVHRQAAGNPVLQMATMIRQGQNLAFGNYGDSKVIPRSKVDRHEVMGADQVLVGTNATRHAMNARIRELLGRKTVMPERGDRVVCLRNNHEIGLLNGESWNVEDCALTDEHTVELSLKQTQGDGTNVVTAHGQYFQGKEPPFWHIKEKECFDYANAMTGHKAQGSQWDRTFLFDESRVFRADARKWLYTTLTRAAKQTVVVMDN